MDLAELPEAAALADYFESRGRGFAAAARSAGGVIDRFYLVAGRQLRLRFAGPALLASLTRALGHLETSAGPDPAGSILIWDGRSTARAIPPAPFPAQFEITRGP